MVGGMWVVDHIGPDRVAAGNARRDAYPELYLAELRKQFDVAVHHYHADIHYPSLLGILGCRLPDEAKRTAREWMPKIRAEADRARRAPRYDGEQRTMPEHVVVLQQILDGKFVCRERG